MSDTALNKIIQYGTATARGTFTPSPASGSKIIYIWYETDTGNTYLYDTAWHLIASSGGGTVIYPSRCEGRLTVVSGTPVPTTDQTAKSNLYWTPCDSSLQSIAHGVISLWNGSAIVDVSVTEITKALSGLTSGKNYDIFIDYNSGTPQIVLSAAWTNDTTRADALSSQYDSVRLETIIIKSGTAAYRWVGTIRTTGTTTTEDSEAKRFVWNTYNQTQRRCYISSTNSHTYAGSNVTRQWDNSTANQLDFIDGLGVQGYHVSFNSDQTAPASGTPVTSFGLDAINNAAEQALFAITTASVEFVGGASKVIVPGLGRHFIAMLERCSSASNSTFASFNLNCTIWN